MIVQNLSDCRELVFDTSNWFVKNHTNPVQTAAEESGENAPTANSGGCHRSKQKNADMPLAFICFVMKHVTHMQAFLYDSNTV
jgi:hypothetical protein